MNSPATAGRNMNEARKLPRIPRAMMSASVHGKSVNSLEEKSIGTAVSTLVPQDRKSGLNRRRRAASMPPGDLPSQPERFSSSTIRIKLLTEVPDRMIIPTTAAAVTGCPRTARKTRGKKAEKGIDVSIRRGIEKLSFWMARRA